MQDRNFSTLFFPICLGGMALSALMLLSGCPAKVRDPLPDTTPKPAVTTVEPAAKTDINAILAATAGDPKAKTVVVYAQGGPLNQPDTVVLAHLAQTYGNKHFYVVPHQVQTQNPAIFDTQDVTFEQAKQYASQSTQNLAATVKAFKAMDRRVIVLGLSYGAFVTADLLAEYGNTADAYVMLVGRLDMPAIVWRKFANGNPVGFVDGTKVVEVSLDAAGMGGGNDIADRNMMRLAAGLAYKRYTTLLRDVDLANVHYAYSLQDEQVGQLSPAERDFLKQKGAKTHEFPGDHLSSAQSALAILGRELGL
ncbi:hypothetical protein IQ266_16375 [filamentous cyanobacterium LEGE 11480]|uniref:Alpha/beta hydrolase n=1 Tax=Romeriopsis navalis LEGE 11480 TaxID=2777977 RepID=A0A928VRP1_9CYAN|nr:hypothetical protein [Romeriopsis navalis]MBE9031312.1 hypothetical protein [Romeriopsis navalis LEGE 11480]